jgi:HlyD family secretion protein
MKAELMNLVRSVPAALAVAGRGLGKLPRTIMDGLQKGEPNSIQQLLRRGWLGAVFMVGGVLLWSTVTNINAAVVAPGALVVDTNVKKIQHLQGGIVEKVHVKDGDRVQPGQTLVKLDETLVKANLNIIIKQLAALETRRARLVAEREDVKTIVVPKLVQDRLNDPDIQEAFKAEQRLFESRARTKAGQKSQLDERIAQLNEEITGLTSQRVAKERELSIITAEVKSLEDLFRRNLVSLQRFNPVQRDGARIQGEHGQLVAAVAQARGKIAEVNTQKLQIDQEFQTKLLDELKETEAKIADLSERRVAAEEQLERIEIKAPVAGIVHQTAVHAVGQVLAPGEQAMLVVPEGDDLYVESRIATQDIDKVRIGRPTLVRFSAFNMHTTPEVSGVVTRVSADAVREQQTGMTYFLARVLVSASERERLGKVTLVPGMPVEVFIETGSRSAISYFVKPLTDQFARAFRDQ